MKKLLWLLLMPVVATANPIIPSETLREKAVNTIVETHRTSGLAGLTSEVARCYESKQKHRSIVPI